MDYEIHVTVDRDGPVRERLPNLRAWFPGLRLHVFDNVIAPGQTKRDHVVTLSARREDDDAALKTMEKLVQHVARTGALIEREKIEVAPWHPTLPLDGAVDMTHETHMVVWGLQPLAMQSVRVPLTLWSVNARTSEIVATVRTRGYRKHHVGTVHSVVHQMLKELHALPIKIDQETVLHDSNPDHDAEWEASIK
jgi:hypothetical protein